MTRPGLPPRLVKKRAEISDATHSLLQITSKVLILSSCNRMSLAFPNTTHSPVLKDILDIVSMIAYMPNAKCKIYEIFYHSPKFMYNFILKYFRSL